MKIKIIVVAAISLLLFSKGMAQHKDSVKTLKEIIVKGYKTVNGVGHLLESEDGIIYAGKKTEVIVVDSLDANKAINNTRQILGRIPGLNIVETESSGFTANGIATRGLNPTQSIEMNTRQNGYNISAEVYGYNEAYYIPPMEAVKRIELIRGAASLQFGAQFGGLVNYILEEAPKNKPFQFTTSQTSGSFGMFNSFNSIGGNYKKWSYYGFLQYRNMDGYRPNSQQWQLSGFGKVKYTPSDKMNIDLEYSLLRNKIQMPGGLSDSLFKINPKASIRARNWLKSPWNILANTINLTPNDNTTIGFKTTYLFSNRSLVWRNEDGGASALDTIDPATNQFVPREVESEDMRSIATEARFSTNYKLGKNEATLAAGIRLSYASFKRLEGGEGTTGSDFDLSITGVWETNMNFSTTNVAPFVENIFRIGKRFIVTPGMRLEFLKSTAIGYSFDEDYKIITDKSKTRKFVLTGIGVEYKTKPNTAFYGNISQAYRPIDYNQQQPFGVDAKIDPNLKDAFGFNSDLGFRTIVSNYLNVDASWFYLAYNNRIGVVLKTDPSTGEEYAYRTNIANSVHKGLEAYIEFNILKYLNKHSKQGLSVFNSLSFIDAKYTSGEFKGNRVEAAPNIIERAGVVYSNRNFSSTFQFNYTGDSFGDATNVKIRDNPVAGYIPAYTVLDLSATYKINNFSIKCGVNNLADQSYFTRRTDEYPGPGIIPAVGRSFYAGFTAKF
ncbi:MAG: TonB-dependent receptor [Bacteroidota bacterium]|nr:TonB-dependent receptor [Bacteroidota bacterium]